jgi:hypothetical protein
MTSISGVTFEEAARNALLQEIDGISVKVLFVDDLIRNKLASGRPKDLVDVALLQNRSE